MKKSPWSDAGGSKNRPRSDARSDATEEQEDPLNPAIPKAPLIPHDIARMPNAVLPVWSMRPEDRGAERPTLGATTNPRDHVDARPPPGVTPSTYQSAAMPPHSASLPRIPRVSPPGTGTAQPVVTIQSEPPPPAPASPRPTAVESHTQPRSNRARWIAGAIALALAAAGAVWISGALN